MSWIITGTEKLPSDPDAAAYIAAVEAADGQALEYDVRMAINAFVRGCKADGVWDAIKASCILAGARTLNGALVPLAGTAPTNYNFASGDYDRKTGLVGDGSTKYLDSNRSNNADPQNNNHNAVYATLIGAVNGTFIAALGEPIYQGTNFIAGSQSDVLFTRNRSSLGTAQAVVPFPGFLGHARSASTAYQLRANEATTTINVASDGVESSSVLLFRRGGAATTYASHRLAFYSIGEALDLTLLDARVTTLINAFAAAIP